MVSVSVGGSHPLARLTDQRETYGPHVMERLCAMVGSANIAVDIGAGSGRDLEIVRRVHPGCKTIAVEYAPEFAQRLIGKADQVEVLNIERDRLPFDEGAIDLIIANQVLEHTKEIFWIFDQVSRALKPGGHFIFGVPNVLSLHNRLLGLFGVHPTQHKLASAHVRPFSKLDTVKFLDACSPGTYRLKAFCGSQFYPFPRSIARLTSAVFPGMAFSIFFCLEKVGNYEGGFLSFPREAELETNFYVGDG